MSKKTVKALSFVVVGEDGKLEDVDPVRATPGSAVVFVLGNESRDKYEVEITDFVLKESTVAAVPFRSGLPGSRVLDPGEVDVLRGVLHPKTRFGAGAPLPYTTFKFSIKVTNRTTGVVTVHDPDLDVPPADS
jgi:hypothetical protein